MENPAEAVEKEAAICSANGIEGKEGRENGPRDP